MTKAQTLTTETLAVDGVEVVATAPEGSRVALGPFYADELELLRLTLRSLRNRHKHVVAQDGVAWNIYRQP